MFAINFKMNLSLIICCVLLSFTCAKPQNASVSWDPTTEQFVIHDSIVKDAVATAVFTDEIFQTGWSYLEVQTSEFFPDSIQAYAAGLVEGHLTKYLLRMHWNNTFASYCEGEKKYCSQLEQFLIDNQKFTSDQIKRGRTEDYWHQVALVFEQLSGIEDAYYGIPGQPRTYLDPMGLMLLNLFGDLIDLEDKFNRIVKRQPFGGGSCSALVKALPKNKDIYFSHVTWTSYNTMLRILKKYDIAVHTNIKQGSDVVPGRTYTFSSQPGLVGSLDDFYLISSGLVTVETTITNTNNSLWQFVTPKSVLEWVRSIVANRLASNGKEWTDVFSHLNSGTYNNQWMILDYKLFSPGKPLKDNLLWLSEQMPGYMHNADVTHVLREQGYWPSYNRPFFKDIFNISGAQQNVDKHGDWFSYERTPRALIFKRDQPKVHDITSMTKLMRYNDFMKDPLSRCNCTPPYSAYNAISARSDLNPINGTYPIDVLGHRADGATDMKLTTSTLFQKLQFVAIGGPTHDPLPPFQWSKSDFGTTVRHEGHPDLWVFKPIVHKWQSST